MENFDVLTIISLVLGAIATIFGAFWAKVKGRLSLLIAAGKAFIAVADELEVSLADNKITPEEAEKLKSKLHAAKEAFKAVFKKAEA